MKFKCISHEHTFIYKHEEWLFRKRHLCVPRTGISINSKTGQIGKWKMENSTLSRLPHSTIEITMRREWRINQKHTFVLKHRTRSRSFPITFRDISAHAKRVFVTSYQRFYYNIYKKPSYLRNVCIGCLFYRGRLSSAVSSKDSYI